MKRQPTEEQKAAAAARREKFRGFVKQVAQMTDEEKARMTNQIGAVMTCEGRALSLGNTLLLMVQCPQVSMVGGFHQWLKAGRCVRKGERGHMAWHPSGKKAAEAQPAAEVSEDDMSFFMITYFDVSQTDEISKEKAA